MMPNPTRIMYRDGGGWYTWERHLAGRKNPGGAIGQYNKGDNDRLAAVEFDDGSVFHAIDGWRAAEPE